MDQGNKDADEIRPAQPGSTHRGNTDRTEAQTMQSEKNWNTVPGRLAESDQAVGRLASFPQLNPFPILETDSEGRVTYCNPAATSVLAQLGSDASPDIFLPSGMDEILDALRQGRKALFNREVRLGKLVFSENIYTAPEFQSVRIYASDITERVRAEEMLRDVHRELENRIQERTEELRASNETLKAAQQKLFALLDGLPAIVCLLAPDRTLRFANRRFRERFGDPKGHQCFEVMAERSQPCKTCTALRVLESRTPVEWQWKSPAGTVYQLYDYPFAGPDGSPMVLKLGIDITERKRSEEALRKSEKQLRSLSAQLLQVQEAERARISRELHDELGQALTIMKLRLGAIRKRLRKDQRSLGEDCDETLKYIDQIIEDVRRLSRDLSPRVLEDLGLVAALRRLVNEFAQRTGKEVASRIDDIRHLLSEDAEIIVYRIVQEALTNIGRHAEAERVSLNMEGRDDGVRCVIEDNGKGFEFTPDAVSKGMGIAIMKERVRMLGGSLDVWSQPGHGTRISFLIPAGSQGTRQ